MPKQKNGLASLFLSVIIGRQNVVIKRTKKGKFMEHNEIFETMPVRQAYFKMALPVVFSMVVSLIYNMVDTYFIAKTGNTDLIAGVSLGVPVFTLMIALGDILGLGGSSVISRLFGEQKVEDGKRLSVFCFWGAIVLGLLTTVVMLGLRTPILNLLGADQHTMEYTSQYFSYLAMGAPFIILSFTPGNLLRSEGMAQEAMVGTVLGAVVNMILDPVFIFGLQMGAGGAAIATVIGYVVSDATFVWILIKKSQNLSANPRLLKITMPEFGAIVAIGIPASITNFMQSVGVALTNRYLLLYGNDKIASMGIVMKVNMIAVLVLVGFAFGGQALVGYNYGSGNRKRFGEIVRFSYQFEVSLAAVLAVILGILAKPLIGLFVQDESLIANGVWMLRLQLAGMIFVAIVLITTCIFQATGKAMGAFILSASRQGVLFAIILIVLSKLFGYYGVLVSQALSDFFTALIGLLLYRKLLGESHKLHHEK